MPAMASYGKDGKGEVLMICGNCGCKMIFDTESGFYICMLCMNSSDIQNEKDDGYEKWN